MQRRAVPGGPPFSHAVKGLDPEMADVAIALRNSSKLADAAASATLVSRLKTLAAGL